MIAKYIFRDNINSLNVKNNEGIFSKSKVTSQICQCAQPVSDKKINAEDGKSITSNTIYLTDKLYSYCNIISYIFK